MPTVTFVATNNANVLDSLLLHSTNSSARPSPNAVICQRSLLFLIWLLANFRTFAISFLPREVVHLRPWRCRSHWPSWICLEWVLGFGLARIEWMGNGMQWMAFRFARKPWMWSISSACRSCSRSGADWGISAVDGFGKHFVFCCQLKVVNINSGGGNAKRESAN